MKYKGYNCDYGSTFIPEGNESVLELDENPVLVFECEAESWTEAMTKWHQFNDWEPYVPIEDR